MGSWRELKLAREGSGGARPSPRRSNELTTDDFPKFQAAGRLNIAAPEDGRAPLLADIAVIR